MGRKLIIFIPLIICAFFLALICYYKISEREKLFIKPTNLAQKIANYVVDNGETYFFVSGGRGAEEQRGYNMRAYNDSDIYEIRLWASSKMLDISYYQTNYYFSRLHDIKDVVAEEIMFGSPKILIESHFFDDGMMQKISTYQEFSKLNSDGNLLVGFTREERDSREKFGIQQFLFEDGKILKNGKWVDASLEEMRELDYEYNHILQIIAKIFKIK